MRAIEVDREAWMLSSSDTMTMATRRGERVASGRVLQADAELVLVERRRYVTVRRQQALAKARRLGPVG